MTREEAIQWLKVINTKEFGWDEFALQESQREIRERCEQGVREAFDMAIEALANLKEEFESAEYDDYEHATLVDIKEPLKVSVVRCKDCRHWLQHEQFGFDEDNGEYHDYCALLVPDDDYYAYTRKADDFCSYGERKQDD